MPYTSFKLTDDTILASSNLGSDISNLTATGKGKLFADTERSKRFESERGGLVVNDIDAIAAGEDPQEQKKSAEIIEKEQKKSAENLENVLKKVIVNPGLISAAKELQEQTYVASYTQTQISYKDKLYMCNKPHEEFVYYFSKGEADDFTFTTLRKEVVSKLIALDNAWEHPVLTLDDSGSVCGDTLDNIGRPPGKKPIYTFTDKTIVTYGWLDLDTIKKKITCEDPKGLEYLTANQDVLGSIIGKTLIQANRLQKKADFKTMERLLNELESVEKNDRLQEYRDNNPAVKDRLRMSPKGKIQMVFQDKTERETHFQIDHRFNAINDGLGFKKEEEQFVGLDVVASNPCYSEVAYIANKIDLILEAWDKHSGENPDDQIKRQIEELLQYGIEPLIAKPEFKQDQAAFGVLSKSLGKASSFLKARGSEGNIELIDNVAIKETLLTENLSDYSDASQAIEAKEGASPDDMKLVGVRAVETGENPYTDADHIAIIIDYIIDYADKSDSNDAQKKQIEMLLEHRIKPLMANEEFKKDIHSIATLYNKLNDLLDPSVELINAELIVKVDDIMGLLLDLHSSTPESKQNEIKSGYERDIKWHKAESLICFSVSLILIAAVIVIALVVPFPPALAVLSYAVPAVLGVASLVTLKLGMIGRESEKQYHENLERYNKQIADPPHKSTEFNKGRLMSAELKQIVLNEFARSYSQEPPSGGRVNGA